MFGEIPLATFPNLAKKAYFLHQGPQNELKIVQI